MRYMHMLLLYDLSPPWLTRKFPQALPGDGVLSRYTRPSFLQWLSDTAVTLFGEEVMKLLGQVASAVSLDVAGLLARPLYVCTNYREAPEAEMCMSVASMSQFIQQAAGRQQYRCKKCVASAGGASL